MQSLYPEGGCFFTTLYVLAWTNLILVHEPSSELRRLALSESESALRTHESILVAGRFSDTQVRRGVFWLGQRNAALGQYLACLPAEERPADFVQEFHANSAALHAAFLASPTSHLDSYPGMCWPADNVTALYSLSIHDALYGTDYGDAFERWKAWTEDHPDPPTGLPAGMLDAASGALLQPARGCANSWMLALMPRMDREYAGTLYDSYRRHFQVRLAGFRLFREHGHSHRGRSDVDSGPVVLGVGTVATGAGLAAALANGDHRTAQDIHGVAGLIGLRRETRGPAGPGIGYLGGKLPMGDAFLTWAYSLSSPDPGLQTVASPLRLAWDRKWISLVVLLLSALLVQATRRVVRQRRGCLSPLILSDKREE